MTFRAVWNVCGLTQKISFVFAPLVQSNSVTHLLEFNHLVHLGEALHRQGDVGRDRYGVLARDGCREDPVVDLCISQKIVVSWSEGGVRVLVDVPGRVVFSSLQKPLKADPADLRTTRSLTPLLMVAVGGPPSAPLETVTETTRFSSPSRRNE